MSNKPEYDMSLVGDDIKMEFMIEGVRRQAIELLDMSKKSSPPTKNELMAIAGMLTVAIAVVSDFEVPDHKSDTGESAKDVIDGARKLLFNIQKEKDEENGSKRG